MAAAAAGAEVEDMRRTILTFVVTVLFGTFAHGALAGGGSYTFAGGTAGEQATVRAALAASSFDWNLIPRRVTVHIGIYADSFSTPGDVYLESALLDSGKFAWGVVQHEFGHQVDFFLLDDAKRALLQQALGASDWCYQDPALRHSDHGCERFASELAWSYWPSADNSMQPSQCGGESAGMPVAQFRALLAQLIGAPSTVSTPQTAKAYAPKTKPKHRTKRR
jgi:hypothetical protein